MTPSDRCRAEIAEHEQALRDPRCEHCNGAPAVGTRDECQWCNGTGQRDPEMQGVLQALQDWAGELREIDRMMEGTKG